MALVPATLRDNIKSALLDKDNATDTLSTLASTCHDYIKSNTLITFAWTAALPNPPNTPDPVIVATGEIVSLTFTLTPSMATSQPVAMNTLKTQLIAGLTLGTYNITQSGFATTPALMSTSPSLSLLTLNINGSDQDTALLQLATGIIDWVKAQVPSGPCSGNHAAYVGAGLVTSIV
jgi:hypothetical protein